MHNLCGKLAVRRALAQWRRLFCCKNPAGWVEEKYQTWADGKVVNVSLASILELKKCILWEKTEQFAGVGRQKQVFLSS